MLLVRDINDKNYFVISICYTIECNEVNKYVLKK